MIIDNPETLRTWLLSTLEKLCEADPIALARYVLALIKKDKPVEELKSMMQENMEVFLLSETKDFVMLLFNTLETKSYLTDPTPKLKTEEKDVEETLPIAKELVEPKEDPSIGKPDSTTVVAKTVVEAPEKDVPYKPTKRGFEEEPRVSRPKRSPVRRRDSPPHRHRVGGSRRYRSRSPVFRRLGSPFSRRRRSSPHRRSRSRSYSPSRKFHSRGSTPTKDEDGLGYIPSVKDDRKLRCRDYDEKGFCMKGDLCPYEHGNDALVYPAVVPPAAPFPEPYVPASTVPLPPLHIPPPGYPPETVSSIANRKRTFQEVTANLTEFPPVKRFDYNRVGRGRGIIRGRGGRGGLVHGGPTGSQSTHLAVRNIPPGMNTIAHLNNHFVKFGALINIQVHFEGDPASALVTYSSPSEAEQAIKSSEAVLGNRFIKVFYHNVDTNPNNVPVNNRPNDKKLVNLEGDSLTKTIVNEDAAKVGTSTHQTMKEEQKNAEILAIKKNQEVLEAKAKLQKSFDQKNVETREKVTLLRKAKQELLDKYIGEQKKLLTLLEEKKSTIKAEEKTGLLTLIKSLTTTIDQVKEDLKKLVETTVKRRSLSDIKKDLLDAELELFTAQQSGHEVLDIQKRVNQLKVEAARHGGLPTSHSPRTRGSQMFYSRGGSPGYPRIRGRGRGRFQGHSVNIDRRPSKILVSGFELEEKDAVIAHFAKYGEVLDSLEDEVTPSVIIHYKTRRFAEEATAQGKAFKDRVLQISWYTGATPSDFQPELAPENIDQQEEVEDDYTPLDPAYLPPGIEEGGGDKPDSSVTSKGANESNDDFGHEDLGGDLLGEDDDDEEDGIEGQDGQERSWKH